MTPDEAKRKRAAEDHHSAMAHVDEADGWKEKGCPDLVISSLLAAAHSESRAAMQIDMIKPSHEPTRSILYRSAAILAHQASVALAEQGLLGSPDAQLRAELEELLGEPRSSSPPYVFPDRRPAKYDATAKGELWVVCGPLFTDGTGWRWDMTHVDELVPGDIWVPIHLLHTVEIPEVAARSRELANLMAQLRRDSPTVAARKRLERRLVTVLRMRAQKLRADAESA